MRPPPSGLSAHCEAAHRSPLPLPQPICCFATACFAATLSAVPQRKDADQHALQLHACACDVASAGQFTCTARSTAPGFAHVCVRVCVYSPRECTCE